MKLGQGLESICLMKGLASLERLDLNDLSLGAILVSNHVIET